MNRFHKNMLPALGRLNADLLSAHYAPSPPESGVVCDMVRRAKALQDRAHMDCRVACAQNDALHDELELMYTAACVRHVATYVSHGTTTTTLCVGPCVRVPRRHVSRLRKVFESKDVHQLTHVLRDVLNSTTTMEDPRLCMCTGIPCVSVQFEKSDDVKHVVQLQKDARNNKRVLMAREIVKESNYTHELARQVASSHICELEVGKGGETWFGGGNSGSGSGGGGGPSVSDFFKTYALGVAHDDTCMKHSLDVASKHFAPRSRRAIVNDLWSRWMMCQNKQ